MPLTAHLETNNPFQAHAESPRLVSLLSHHTSRDSSSPSSASTPLPSPRPVTHEPESLSAGAISLEFLQNIQRVEINETRMHDGETFFVLDIFLHHFNTRLPANLIYLRRAGHSTTSSSSSVFTTTGEENITPDYRVERRFIDFCDLRHQVYDAATLTPHIRCTSCDEFICYVRFKLRQPRPVTHLLTTGRKAARRAILAAFVNDFLHMALCKDKQNRKFNVADRAEENVTWRVQPSPHPSELLINRTDHNFICTQTHESLIAMALVLPTVHSLDRAGHNLNSAASLSPSATTTPRKSHKRSSWSHTLGELQPVAMTPERWSLAAMPTAFLENIQRVEINETHERDGETFFVLDVFLHCFDTRLPANLAYLRRALHSASNPSSGITAAAAVKENARPDYQVERRFIDFCDLRHQVYDAATLTPHIRCTSCDEFICYVRFKLRQPRPVAHLLTTGRKAARRAILAAFVNDFLHMALCKDKQNRKCESHGVMLTALESFLRAPGSSPSSHARHSL